MKLNQLKTEDYSKIYSGIMDGVVLINLDYTFSDVNSAACNLLGLKKKEIIGKHCYKIYHRLSKPCSEKGWRCPVKELSSGRVSLEDVHEHFTKKGDKHYFSILAHPVTDENDKVVQILETFQDITEDVMLWRETSLLGEVDTLHSKDAKEEETFDVITAGLTNLFNYKLSVIHLLNKSKNSLTCKSYSMDSKILNKAEKLAGEKALGYEIPLFEGSLLKKIIETKEPVTSYDVIELIKGHTEKEHLRALALPIAKIIKIKCGVGVPLLAGDKLVGMIGVGSERELSRKDVERLARVGRQVGVGVDRAVLYEDLEEAYEELKELDKLKDDIISNVSHELRTPITICSGLLELAMEEKDDKKRKELLISGREALFDQNRIVRDLLNIVKIKKRAQELKLVSVNLKKVVETVVHDMSPRAKKDDIKIKTSIPEDLYLKTDFTVLHHIISNLLDNAIKFNEKGGKISIVARKKGEFAEVSVADTGIGISKDKLPKIFDRFFQADVSSSRAYGGTGLGLAVVKEIIQAHGGEIGVESGPGKGSRFYFTLLIAKKA